MPPPVEADTNEVERVYICIFNQSLSLSLSLSLSFSFSLSLFLSLSLTHSLVPSSVKRRRVEKLRGAAKAISFFGGKPACNISGIET